MAKQKTRTKILSAVGRLIGKKDKALDEAHARVTQLYNEEDALKRARNCIIQFGLEGTATFSDTYIAGRWYHKAYVDRPCRTCGQWPDYPMPNEYMFDE